MSAARLRRGSLDAVASAPPQADALRLGLRQARFAKRLTLGLLFGFIPWMLVVGTIAERRGISLAWCFIPYAVALFSAGLWGRQLRCPRCGNRFFVLQDRRSNAFASCCMNCSLGLQDVDA